MQQHVSHLCAGNGLETVNLGLLCANTFMAGPGVLYKMRFRALENPGPSIMRCATGTRFYRAGLLVTTLACDSLPIYVGLVAGVPGGD